MIPKIIHQIWIGEVEMPTTFTRLMYGERKRYKSCMESVVNAHPDYEHILWNNKSILKLAKEMHPLAKEKFDSLYDQKMWAYAVNIARLYILYKYGGIYMDTDIHMTKNASLNMLPLEKDLILVHPGKYKNKNKIRFQNCVLCASKNNAFIKKVYDRIGTQGYSVLGGGGGEHPLYEKYSTTYLTSEYHIHTSKKKHGMNNYPAICFDRRRIIVPETDCILDPNYFFGPKPLIATHLDMASHNVFKRYKFIKDLGTPTP